MQLATSIRTRRTVGAALAAAVAGLPLMLAAVPSAPAGAAVRASASPITIAYVTDLTGEGASENCTSPAGFDARIAMQNAEGGVHGHKLVPLVIDDQTNPSQIATAVQEADSKAFGIVSQSPLFFLAAKYPNQAGVPVTGTYDDGPEWGTQPYTNMFASDEGSVNPKYPVNTQIGNFLKQHGGHRPGLLRVRDFTLVGTRGGADCAVLPACRWQGGRPGHVRSLRQRGLHERGVDGQAGRGQRHGARHGRQLELRLGRGAPAIRRQAQGHALRHGI